MHLLHVGFGSGMPKRETLEKVFDAAESWLRYGSSCWLLWTDESADEWTVRLEELIEDENRHFLIYRLDPSDRQGWLQENAWDWIRKRESKIKRKTVA